MAPAVDLLAPCAPPSPCVPIGRVYGERKRDQCLRYSPTDTRLRYTLPYAPIATADHAQNRGSRRRSTPRADLNTGPGPGLDGPGDSPMSAPEDVLGGGRIFEADGEREPTVGLKDDERIPP